MKPFTKFWINLQSQFIYLGYQSYLPTSLIDCLALDYRLFTLETRFDYEYVLI